MDLERTNFLKKKSKELRRKVIDLSLETGEAHLGGSFSEIEILISLYEEVLGNKDKFILSKGHACYPLYKILEERGYSPKISGHPNLDTKNEIFCTTGSLGHGYPIGSGMALARKLQNKEGNIYILMGDGECQEGTTWETASFTSGWKLNNLTTIVDYNKIQGLDRLEDIVPTERLKEKFIACGCNTFETDGHDFNSLINVLRKNSGTKPKVIIAHTIKGKGVSYMENDSKWHNRIPNNEELKQAYEELK